MNHRSLTLIAAAALSLPAMAAQGAGFYDGKTVTLMVPSGLGASMGLYGRLVASGMEKYMPGKGNIIVVSRPGAGGTKGTSYAYNAGPADGSFIAMISAGNVTIPVLRKMKYDPTQFQWLGSITPRSSVIWLWHTSPVKKLDQAKQTQVIIGSTGKGSGTTIWPTLMNSLIGTKFKIIQGYKGGAAINKAAEQGEVFGRWSSYSGLTASKKQWLQSGKIRVIAQFGPYINAEKQAPNFHDMVSGSDRKIVEFMELSERVGLALWVRPGVPKDRLDILRKAFKDAMTDPDVIAGAKRRGAPINYVSGPALGKMVANAYKITDAQKVRLRKLLGIK